MTLPDPEAHRLVVNDALPCTLATSSRSTATFSICVSFLSSPQNRSPKMIRVEALFPRACRVKSPTGAWFVYLKDRSLSILVSATRCLDASRLPTARGYERRSILELTSYTPNGSPIANAGARVPFNALLAWVSEGTRYCHACASRTSYEQCEECGAQSAGFVGACPIDRPLLLRGLDALRPITANREVVLSCFYIPQGQVIAGESVPYASPLYVIGDDWSMICESMQHRSPTGMTPHAYGIGIEAPALCLVCVHPEHDAIHNRILQLTEGERLPPRAVSVYLEHEGFDVGDGAIETHLSHLEDF